MTPQERLEWLDNKIKEYDRLIGEWEFLIETAKEQQAEHIRTYQLMSGQKELTYDVDSENR